MNIAGANNLQANEFTIALDGADIDTIVSFDAFAYLTPEWATTRSSASCWADCECCRAPVEVLTRPARARPGAAPRLQSRSRLR